MIAFHCAPSRGTLCDVTTHRRTALPTFILPMLATLVAAPFDSEDWTFEIKWDGFRVEAVIDHGRSRIWTRGQQDAAGYFDPSSTRSTGSRRMKRSSTARSSRSTTAANPISPCCRRGSRKGTRRPDDALRLRGLRPDVARRPIATGRASRCAAACSRTSSDRSSRAAERGHSGGWVGVLPRRPGAWARGASWPRTAARDTNQADHGLAEDQDPSGTGTGGRGLGEGDRQGSRAGPLRSACTRTGGSGTPARSAPGSMTRSGPISLAAMANLATDEQPFAEPPPRPVSKNALWLKPRS